MAEDGMETAARMLAECVKNAQREDWIALLDEREDRLASTQHRLDGMCSIVYGLVRKLDSFETQVSTCAEVVKSVGDPRLAMRRNVEAFVTQMEDRISEKVDRLDKLVRAVCDRLDQQGQLLATAAEDIGNAKAEWMRLDEVARQQSERMDGLASSNAQKSSIGRRVERLERDLEALEIVAFKGSPVIGPSWKSRLETMAARVDDLSKSVGEVESAVEKCADPDRNPTSLNWVAREIAAASKHVDLLDRGVDAGWRSKNGVRPGDMIGLGSFIPQASPDPTTSSIEQRNAALELAHAEIRRLTMALETVKARLHESIRERSNVVTEGCDVRHALESSRAQVHVLRTELERAKAKLYEDGRTHQTALADAHALRNQITAIDKDRTELRAEIRRLVEHGSEAAERMQTKTDADEQAEWRKTAEVVLKHAREFVDAGVGVSDLAEAIELHEKACSERARDLPF
jgi:chromosome segregation ATPase